MIDVPMTIANVARDIRDDQSSWAYDHRIHLPANLPAHYYTEDFRRTYACFKSAVAKVLQPGSIIEIGVGCGIAAMAFLHGCPTASYMGIDNDCEAERDFPIHPSRYVNELLAGRGHVKVADSTKMDRLPTAALVHIDGGHSYDDAYSDVLLAWRSNARWILVDDARYSTVSSATFDALHRKSPGSVDWAYFEDTWTGNILISRVKERP